MTQQKKTTRKQRDKDRMERDGKPLHFVVRAHLHPETFEPLIRFKVDGKMDVSVPVNMMRHLASMIMDGAIMAELMAGHAKILQADPELTMQEFGEMAGATPTPAEHNAALHEASNAFQAMMIEAWELGAVRGETHTTADMPPEVRAVQDQIKMQLERMRERLDQPMREVPE